jgi:hypothetical protein
VAVKIDIEEPVSNSGVNLEFHAIRDAPESSQVVDSQSSIPAPKDDATSRIMHAKVMNDTDVQVSDDMHEQVRETLRLLTQSQPCMSPRSMTSEDLLSQQMEQMGAELVSLRQCLSESHQKIQDKISLTQEPPLADQLDWTSQVADALRPVLREEIQRSTATANISWSKGFAPREQPLQARSFCSSPRDPTINGYLL